MAGRDFLKRQALAAAALGHVLEVSERVPGRKGSWRASCSCSWRSSDRRTQAVALGAGFHHLGQVAGDAQRNGSDTPKIVEEQHQQVSGL